MGDRFLRWAAKLRTRVAALALAAAVPPMLALMYFQTNERDEEVARAIFDVHRAATVAAARQAAELEGVSRLLGTLSRIPQFAGAARGDCQETLAAVLRDHRGYRNILILDRSGSVFCAGAPIAAPPANWTVLPWFVAASTTGSVATGDPAIDPQTGRPAVVVARAIAGSEGRVGRVIAASVELAPFSRLLREGERPVGGQFTLFDRSQSVVATFPFAPASEGGRPIGSSPRAATPDSDLRASVPVILSRGEATGLTVVLELNRLTAFAAVERRWRFFMSLTIVAGLFSSILVGIVANRLVLRPSRALVDVAHRLAAGDLGARADLRQGFPELNELGDAVNAMASAVEVQQLERDAALSTVRLSEDRYRLLFELHPSAMWVFDAISLRFLLVNEAAVHRYGYTREEFLAMTILDIWPVEDAELHRLGGSLFGPDLATVPRRHRLKVEHRHPC